MRREGDIPVMLITRKREEDIKSIQRDLDTAHLIHHIPLPDHPQCLVPGLGGPVPIPRETGIPDHPHIQEDIQDLIPDHDQGLHTILGAVGIIPGLHTVLIGGAATRLEDGDLEFTITHGLGSIPVVDSVGEDLADTHVTITQDHVLSHGQDRDHEVLIIIEEGEDNLILMTVDQNLDLLITAVGKIEAGLMMVMWLLAM